ncbi:hypothetical protein [Jiella avicenniae]|uniref:Uncharacterized protein n=1 Tax=Jiella avicenniae TaxID=2907202 RepID=A0A9X1T672_9HYPH|nr:hypothetical protein [Jiella avicenniae]MCE7029035.1 hypothetical protein [Jiella avicenniae]
MKSSQSRSFRIWPRQKASRESNLSFVFDDKQMVRDFSPFNGFRAKIDRPNADFGKGSPRGSSRGRAPVLVGGGSIRTARMAIAGQHRQCTGFRACLVVLSSPAAWDGAKTGSVRFENLDPPHHFVAGAMDRADEITIIREVAATDCGLFRLFVRPGPS